RRKSTESVPSLSSPDVIRRSGATARSSTATLDARVKPGRDIQVTVRHRRHRSAPGRLNQPALLERGADEGRKERVRFEGFRLQLRMELDSDEPGMLGQLDDLRQHTVGRRAGKPQADLFETALVVDVRLVAAAVPLADHVAPVDAVHPAALFELAVISAEPHR